MWQLHAMYPAFCTAKNHKALSELQETGSGEAEAHGKSQDEMVAQKWLQSYELSCEGHRAPSPSWAIQCMAVSARSHRAAEKAADTSQEGS